MSKILTGDEKGYVSENLPLRPAICPDLCVTIRIHHKKGSQGLFKALVCFEKTFSFDLSVFVSLFRPFLKRFVVAEEETPLIAVEAILLLSNVRSLSHTHVTFRQIVLRQS